MLQTTRAARVADGGPLPCRAAVPAEVIFASPADEASPEAAEGWRSPSSNPFASRFVRPGALPWLGTELAALGHRLEATAGWGEIVGPHGSGKSTLVAALNAWLAARPAPGDGGGWEVRHVRLRAGEASLPPRAWEPFAGRGVLVIDGCEQLGWWTLRRVRRHCRRHRLGLLATAHAPLGLPLVCRTAVTPALATAVIERLLAGRGREVLAGYDVAARLGAHSGSLRGVLAELYDRWEILRVDGSAARGT